MPTDLSTAVALHEIQAEFGDIAGNHTDYGYLDDGWLASSWRGEIAGVDGVLYFLHSEDWNDWCTITAAEFAELRPTLTKEPPPMPTDCEVCGEPDCWPICGRCEREAGDTY